MRSVNRISQSVLIGSATTDPKNKLFTKCQSAYMEGRNVETAPMNVQNNILIDMDNQMDTAVVLLDLSAAFNTVSHSILLHRLEHICIITGEVLSWIKSYLSNKRHVVNDSTSIFFIEIVVFHRAQCLGLNYLIFTLWQ